MTAVADRIERSGGAAASSDFLARTRAVTKRTGRDLRDLLRLLGELERRSSSVYLGAEDEVSDEVVEELADLLRSYRENYPGQEIEISIFGVPEEGQGGARDGNRAEGPG